MVSPTMMRFLTNYLRACVDAAREQGWLADDQRYEYTPLDIETVAGRLDVRLGRYPTHEEWSEALPGYMVDSRYFEEEV